MFEAAAEFSADQPEMVAQDVEQRRVRVGGDRDLASVYGQGNGHRRSRRWCANLYQRRDVEKRADAGLDLRRRRHRRVDRLFPEPARHPGDRHRAHRHRLRRLRQSPAGFLRATGATARRSKLSPGAASTCMPNSPTASATIGAIAGSRPMAVSPRCGIAAPHAPGWLSERVAVGRRLGSPETTAQVHPARFTAAMMRAAEAQGAELRHRAGHRARYRRRAASPGSRSTARRSLSAPTMPSSSRWGRGRSWPPAGFACRRSSGSRGTASFSTPDRRSRPRPPFSNTAKPPARC